VGGAKVRADSSVNLMILSELEAHSMVELLVPPACTGLHQDADGLGRFHDRLNYLVAVLDSKREYGAC
jgi:hypothetical protein